MRGICFLDTSRFLTAKAIRNEKSSRNRMTLLSPSSSRIESSPLYNPDLAPASAERRHWGTYNYAALWISMSVNILTYMLAASLIQGGMNWKQAVITIFVGNVIVMVPMLLNSHPGTKYGIPFPVLARASFGVLGANVAAVLRALVACGWFGIQTWIGGEAISTLLATLAPGWKQVPHGTAICFLLFWLINVAVILKGIEYIRILQGISAPVLLGVGLLLLGWAYHSAGGFGPMLAVPSRFSNFPDFLKFLIPALNGTVGFWATISLNIPDFTRFARSQREQAIGQALALPTTMTLYAFIGIVVTSATVVIYGNAICKLRICICGAGYTSTQEDSTGALWQPLPWEQERPLWDWRFHRCGCFTTTRGLWDLRFHLPRITR